MAQTCGEWNVSIRRACRILEFDTSTYHYKSGRRIRPASRLGSGTSAQRVSATATGRYYNEVRAYGAIGHKVPISLLDPDGVTTPPS
ncbi:hypothetical protein BSQ44_26030 (plasmid) [Aquibium oceanicum]|uniref:Uncharacterized protein n=1 Tax=Aquibium oceanicum TaxID=1670800 RepID=A0A1L3SZT4_9HYPH|nr:hypothetical protein BSQ44_26030 [Aquibium oceanicum]